MSYRLRNSRVLLIGMRGLAAEVAKDIVLAGINALTVMDSEPLGPEDAGNKFLCFNEGENVCLVGTCTTSMILIIVIRV